MIHLSSSNSKNAYGQFEDEKYAFDASGDHHGMNKDLDFLRDDIEILQSIENQVMNRANKRPKIKIKGVKKLKRAKSSNYG